MRIGMILDNKFPPDARVENETKLLIDQGHEIFLFCWDFDGKTRTQIINNINVHYYKLSRKLFKKISPLIFSIPIYKWILRKNLKHFLSQVKLDTVHIHDMVAAGEVQRIVKDLPIILDLHENRPEIMKFYSHVNSFPGKLLINLNRWKKYEILAIQNSDKLIVVTPEAKKYYLTKIPQLKAENIIVAPNTIDTDVFLNYSDNKDIINKYNDSFMILYVGAIAERRGLDTAIKSIKLVVEDIPEIKLVLVGGQSRDINELKKLAKVLRIEKNIIFEGWQDMSLFPSFIKSSDICISPLIRNIHHDTTFANKIFQYMSIGKPLIVSDCPAQQHVVENEGCGFVHKAGDEKDLADKIMKIYKNKNLRKDMGQKGKSFVLNSYNWKVTGQEIVKMYEELESRK